MQFFVIGSPKPQGRPRAFNRGGFTKVYSPVTEWREAVKYKAHECAAIQFDCALQVHISYQFKRPKSHYRTGKYSDVLKDSAPLYMMKRPDLDNLNKAVIDAMQDAGVYTDDSIIIKLSSEKKYCAPGEKEGAFISIEYAGPK